MAKGRGRKPAIANVARPQGFIDDVVYPVVSRVARSAAVKKASGGKSRKVARKVEERRFSSYQNKAEKHLTKMIAREDAGKQARRAEKKFNANVDKESAMERILSEGGPRKAKQDNQYVRSIKRTGAMAYKAQRKK